MHTTHCTALHCTALHCTSLHCTALHNALHCTELHYTMHCTSFTLHYTLRANAAQCKVAPCNLACARIPFLNRFKLLNSPSAPLVRMLSFCFSLFSHPCNKEWLLSCVMKLIKSLYSNIPINTNFQLNLTRYVWSLTYIGGRV